MKRIIFLALLCSGGVGKPFADLKAFVRGLNSDSWAERSKVCAQLTRMIENAESDLQNPVEEFLESLRNELELEGLDCVKRAQGSLPWRRLYAFLAGSDQKPFNDRTIAEVKKIVSMLGPSWGVKARLNALENLGRFLRVGTVLQADTYLFEKETSKVWAMALATRQDWLVEVLEITLREAEGKSFHGQSFWAREGEELFGQAVVYLLENSPKRITDYLLEKIPFYFEKSGHTSPKVWKEYSHIVLPGWIESRWRNNFLAARTCEASSIYFNILRKNFHLSEETLNYLLRQIETTPCGKAQELAVSLVVQENLTLALAEATIGLLRGANSWERRTFLNAIDDNASVSKKLPVLRKVLQSDLFHSDELEYRALEVLYHIPEARPYFWNRWTSRVKEKRLEKDYSARLQQLCALKPDLDFVNALQEHIMARGTDWYWALSGWARLDKTFWPESRVRFAFEMMKNEKFRSEEIFPIAQRIFGAQTFLDLYGVSFAAALKPHASLPSVGETLLHHLDHSEGAERFPFELWEILETAYHNAKIHSTYAVDELWLSAIQKVGAWPNFVWQSLPPLLVKSRVFALFEHQKDIPEYIWNVLETMMKGDPEIRMRVHQTLESIHPSQVARKKAVLSLDR